MANDMSIRSRGFLQVTTVYENFLYSLRKTVTLRSEYQVSGTRCVFLSVYTTFRVVTSRAVWWRSVELQPTSVRQDWHSLSAYKISERSTILLDALALYRKWRKNMGFRNYLYVAFGLMTITYEHLELVTDIKTDKFTLCNEKPITVCNYCPRRFGPLGP